jgi:hypothetical protein
VSRVSQKSTVVHSPRGRPQFPCNGLLLATIHGPGVKRPGDRFDHNSLAVRKSPWSFVGGAGDNADHQQRPRCSQQSTAEDKQPGDRFAHNGPIARHSLQIIFASLSAREV